MVHLRALEMRHYINSGLLKLLVESYEVHACIVTCGELCPGLNTVIRELYAAYLTCTVSLRYLTFR
jgi:hypothetical protein